MSLRERARMTGAAPAAGSLAGAHGFALLKEQVRAIASPDDIAALMVKDRDRARNELRSACRRAFEHEVWGALPAEDRAELASRLIDEVLGFGPLEQLLSDDAVTEVLVNGPSAVFYERGGTLHRSEIAFADGDQLRSLIDRILGPLGRRVDESSPIADARLPEGHRVHVVLPPVAIDGASVSIRKFAREALALSDLVANESIERSVRDLFECAVRTRRSIVVSGGTGSGKTTLLNALSCALPPAERIVTIEDSAELRFTSHPHVVRLEARPRNAEGQGEVTIRDLVISALRMRPDRIVVGECRGAEALDMLQAMNTGHDGSMTTLHANSAADVVARLTTLVRYAVDLPVDVVEANIASAFSLVVQTARSMSGARFVSEIAEPAFDRATRECRMKPLYRRADGAPRGRWVGLPAWAQGVVDLGEEGESEVAPWKRSTSCAA